MRGFSLIEILIALAVVAILASMTIVGFRYFQNRVSLDNNVLQIVSALELARNRTISSLDENYYGVHFSTTSYVVFPGPSYDPVNAANEIHDIPALLEIFSINLNGGGQEIIFDRLTGRTSQPGQIGLRMASDPGQTKIVYIESSGRIGLASSIISTSGRLVDSRHVHFHYSRNITTNEEIIKLVFLDPPNASTTEEIAIKDYLIGGDLDWSGTISAGGENQAVEVRTHNLNNATTTFSITRDRRYNTKAVSMFISGDSGVSGLNSLINYTVDGTTTPGASIYASSLGWQ